MTDARAWTARTTPLVPPVYHAVTYGLDDKSYEDIVNGGLNETWYGRFSNPAVTAAVEPIRRWEGTAAAGPVALAYGETLLEDPDALLDDMAAALDATRDR